MNQTKKRLAIIELAISITDIETIKLQLLKLQPLKSDASILEIITLLEDENYAQAQAHITTYIETPTQTVIQRIPEEEQLIIDEFDFLEIKSETEEDIEEEQETHIEDIKEDIEKYTTIEENTAEKDENRLDTLLNMDADDVMTDNIKINVLEEKEQEYIKEKIDFHLDTVPKDSFFDIIQERSHKTLNNDKNKVSEFTETIPKEIPEPNKEIKQEIKVNNPTYNYDDNSIINTNETVEDTNIKEESLADIVSDIERPSFSVNETNEEVTTITTPEFTINKKDAVITHIHHTLQDLQIQYPPVHKTNDAYSEELEIWLGIISEKEYSESDVEDVLKHIEKLAHTDKAQAALFLLATSATKSQYAQFILARALYRGSILERNLDESFRIMSQLAFRDKCPEAICDIAQFYENGIAVDKDKEEAKILYKEAMELGVQRAVGHYGRLTKEPKGLFSFFKK